MNMQRVIEIVKRLFQFTSELVGAEDLNLGCILDSSGESFLAVSIHTYLYHRTIRSDLQELGATHSYCLRATYEIINCS